VSHSPENKIFHVEKKHASFGLFGCPISLPTFVGQYPELQQKSPCKNPYHNSILWHEIQLKVLLVDSEGVSPSNNQY
jgi:hypothetical protein